MKEPVGRVYVLTNPRMIGLVKIGFTLGAVEGRAKELDGTGTPEPFEIAYQIEVRGPEKLERRAHEKLIHKRVRSSREFFEVDAVEAIVTIRQLAIDPLDEEIHPKHLELVDEAARRIAEERLAEERSKEQAAQMDKDLRYKDFVQKSESFRSQRDLLWEELNSLKLKFESYPAAAKLNRLETKGQELIVYLSLILALTGIGLILVDHYKSALAAWLIFVGLLFFLKKIHADIRKKGEHNLPILQMSREIQGLEFDLERFDKTKPRLDKDLAEYALSNPVRTDKNGFEPSARVSGRFN